MVPLPYDERARDFRPGEDFIFRLSVLQDPARRGGSTGRRRFPYRRAPELRDGDHRASSSQWAAEFRSHQVSIKGPVSTLMLRPVAESSGPSRVRSVAPIVDLCDDPWVPRTGNRPVRWVAKRVGPHFMRRTILVLGLHQFPQSIEEPVNVSQIVVYVRRNPQLSGSHAHADALRA